MSSRATQSQLLEQRIAENAASQEIDLVTWIFERLRVHPDEKVLELCCGTGGQSLKILELLGDSGRLAALDISQDALNTFASKVGEANAEKLTLIEASLDGLSSALRKSGFHRPGFDLIFCAYGLYYSANAEQTLNEARSWMNPGGRMVIVGPFGPNNKPLFDLVRASGATISEPVIFSSERFMAETVLPWGARNFESISVRTIVNRVRWQTAERVLNYWQNTTFYDPQRRTAFEALVRQHFEQHSEFVNEKWVMLVEMTHARA
jgi:ubiquinone/menaquinone biosynthesis C-methylase UbiE